MKQGIFRIPNVQHRREELISANIAISQQVMSWGPGHKVYIAGLAAYFLFLNPSHKKSLFSHTSDWEQNNSHIEKKSTFKDV